MIKFIKPLKWELVSSYPFERWDAKTCIGDYSVITKRSAILWTYPDNILEADTVEAAKEAAQRQHRKRALLTIIELLKH
jgi:hypothetical protein